MMIAQQLGNIWTVKHKSMVLKSSTYREEIGAVQKLGGQKRGRVNNEMDNNNTRG